MKTILTLWHVLGLAWDQFVRWCLPAETRRQRYKRWKNNWSRTEAYSFHKPGHTPDEVKPKNNPGVCVRCGLCESILETIPSMEWSPPETSLPIEFLTTQQGEQVQPYLQREKELDALCPVGAFENLEG